MGWGDKPLVRTPWGCPRCSLVKMGWDHNWTVFFLGLLASFCLFASLALKMVFSKKWDGMAISLEKLGWVEKDLKFNWKTWDGVTVGSHIFLVCLVMFAFDFHPNLHLDLYL